jgi:hypothetical protein
LAAVVAEAPVRLDARLMAARDVHFFWHGRRLGPVHAACLRSCLRVGHHAVLHCYEPPEDVPAGVTLRDARAVMPEADLLRHRKSGSLSLGTNRFRYRLLAAGLGPWSDVDVLFLRPLPDTPWLFGFEDARSINGAILHAPAGSELVRRLCEATADRHFIPPWLPASRRGRMVLRRALGLGKPVEAQPWGVWGPRLLTFLVEECGLTAHAAPIDLFYPLHWSHAPLLRQPGLRLADLATPRSITIHLWHHLADFRDPPPESPLAELLSLA